MQRTFPASPLNHIDTYETGLKDLLNIIRKNKKIILIFVVFFLLAGVAVQTVFPRTYEAQALISVNPQPELVNNQRSYSQSSAPSYDTIILSNVEILRSREVADDVVHHLKLDQNKSFWNGFVPSDVNQARQSAVERVFNNLKIKQMGRSFIVSVQYRHGDPHIASLVANNIAESYQRIQLKEKSEFIIKNKAWLKSQMEVLSQKLRDSLNAVGRYRSEQNLIDGANVEITSQQLNDVSSQLVVAQADLAAVEAKENQMQNVMAKEGDLETINHLSQSRLISILKQDEANLSAKLADLNSRYGARHPRILSVQAELSEIRRKQKHELDQMALGVNNDVLAAQARVDNLQKNLNKLEEKRRRENEATIGLKELEREAESNRILYEEFLKKYKKMSSIGNSQQADIKIVSKARTPVMPLNPPAILLFPILAAVGCLLGLIAVALLESMQEPIRSTHQAQHMTGLPILSTLSTDAETSYKNIPKIILDKPYHQAAEFIRRLRINIFEGKNDKKLIALTSLLTQEAFSIAFALARSTALTGKKTLIVDLDMRQTPLKTFLSDKSLLKPIHAVLTDPVSSAAQQDTHVKNLSILSGQSIAPNDLESVDYKCIGENLRIWANGYDVVMLNVPDIATSSEALLLMKLADCVICGLNAHQTPLEVVNSTVSLWNFENIYMQGLWIIDA